MASQWRPLRDTLRTLRSGSPLPPSCVHPLCARDPSLLSTLHLDFVYPPSLPTSAPLLPLTLHPPPHFHPRLPRYHPARIYAPAFPLPFPSPILFLLPGPISLSPHLHGRSLSLLLPASRSPPAPLPLLAPSLFLFRPGHANFLRDKSLAIKIGSWAIRVYAILLPSPAPLVSTTMSQDPRRAPRFLADDGEPTSYLGPDSWKIYRILIFGLIFSKYLVKSYSIRNMNYSFSSNIVRHIFSRIQVLDSNSRKIFTML